MRVIPFKKQSLEARCFDLDGPTVAKDAYSGQDSVVFRNGDTAIHVYNNNNSFEKILAYAQCMGAVASSLTKNPFTEDIEFEGIAYKVEVRANPITEVGEKLFKMHGADLRRVYTLSPFIEGLSLCWPYQAHDEQQKAVARCFSPMFYDRVNDYLMAETKVCDTDINPVNVKFKIDRAQQKILLIITDLAKCIGNVHTT
ncbi:TPA: hypothetical protein HA246_02840 [Candidatus Woesearchaeota archaeon]|nr:hypothetical protein [Candidatus Woesearchaeota archaeon]